MIDKTYQNRFAERLDFDAREEIVEFPLPFESSSESASRAFPSVSACIQSARPASSPDSESVAEHMHRRAASERTASHRNSGFESRPAVVKGGCPGCLSDRLD
jgi:hypothetical protein